MEPSADDDKGSVMPTADLGAALVTGAAKRIGKQIVLDLAAEGRAVAIHYHQARDEADALARHIRARGGRAAIFGGDLIDPDTPTRLIDAAHEEFGHIALLVNNASLFEPDGIDTLTQESWTSHLDINLRAPVFLAQAFAAQVDRTRPANIVNIIDQKVWKLTPKYFSYTTSKAALWTVTRTLAQALAPHIRVNAIGPGPALPSSRMAEEDFTKQKASTLLRRGTSPEEISAALRYILSADAMTGQMIALDGGQHLVWQTPDVIAVNE